MTKTSDPVSSNKFILDHLNGSNPLPKDELEDLISKAQAGDIRARNQVITSYLRYIYYLVKKYVSADYLIEDLFEDGVLGLIESIKSYNPSKGSFTTHITPWILKHIRENFRKEKAKSDYLKDLLLYKEDIETDTSHPFTQTYSTKLALDHRLLRHDLDNVLAKYTDEEQSYLANYFGLWDLEPLSIPKIAEQEGVSYSRVQRTLYKLTDKLRNDPSAKALWDGYQAA